MKSISILRITSLLIVTLSPVGSRAADDAAAAAQAYGKGRAAVAAQPDGLLVCEAEEFQPRSPGWQAKKWGENYYSASLANTFLSRKAFLGAPEQCEKTVAEIAVDVPKAGRYLALVRYEAAYRFETQFRVQIEQGGKLVLDRLYGARDNVKIWAFSQKLKKEVGWDWGACENVVWEGHDAFANLQPGRATLRLIADKQPEPAAKRNIDLVMLTTDVEQVAMRIEKEGYLPLDGMLTQSGDLFLKVHNVGGKPVSVSIAQLAGGTCQQHSPYWVHIRNWPKLPAIDVAAGGASDWVEVGGQLDSLNDGQFGFTAKGDELNYKLEFGVKSASGAIESIGSFVTREPHLPLAFFADTRYVRRVRRQEDVLYELLDFLKKQPIHGRAPTRVPIYGFTFDPLKGNAKHEAAVREFQSLFSLSAAHEGFSPPTMVGPRGYIDVRGVATDKLVEYCQKLGGQAQQIRVVSLGDEIGLPTPGGAAATDGFRQWLQAKSVVPSELDPAAGHDWSKIQFNADPKLKDSQPGLFYWSQRYQHHFGIQEMKKRTDILRQQLPNARIGANYSPHHGGAAHTYLGEVFQWVHCFRDDGMTLPWSEDYIFQVPVGSQQMNNINLDLLRAGLRGRPHRDLMYYVMPHWPGNAPNSWKRMFYGAIGHGATMINLFEFRPVQVAYTENYVTHDPMYAMVLRSFRELGQFEEIVADGTRRPGVAGLWFSETADIWHDNDGSFAAAKRGLYTAIIHQQLPLDFIVEQDALDGTLGKYQILYLADRHVATAASKKIAEWVERGGQLFATAGAGMFDEYNRPNAVLRDLLGVEQTALDVSGPQISYLKQDLPFLEPIDHVAGLQSRFPVFAVKARIKSTTAKPIATFSDGSPAATARSFGKGAATYCAFLPSLSYYQPAIPKRPVDRTSAEDGMSHFIPTNFEPAAAALIASPAAAVKRPVECSQPLVETAILESKHGVAIPLVNWSAGPVKDLQVTLHFSPPAKHVSLASGGKASVTHQDGKTLITLDLDVADALIVKP